MVLARLKQRLDAPVDAASLAAFRVLFGALATILAIRFFTRGWIEADYGRPTHFFHYWGFSWIEPLSVAGMRVWYAAMAALGVVIAVGLHARIASAAFAVMHAYAHLSDKTNWLNHYYLVFLLAVLLAIVPTDRQASLRVLLWPETRRTAARRWVLLALRFQIGVVYVFGGLAKIGVDWLFYGEPLRIWLGANAELPIVGPFLGLPMVATMVSWIGLAFNLSIVPLLLARRTRRAAYLVAIVFHVSTWILFPIGLFPWVMLAGATLFFDPSWPRRLLRRPPPRLGASDVAGPPLGSIGRGVAIAYVAVQIAVPLRSLVYPGNTLWTEEGFRFAWKVMLIEKTGHLEFRVVEPGGATTHVDPKRYLTPFQLRMAATQPDMILELSHFVAADYAARGRGPVQVFADAEVAFNGRPRAPLIDSDVDLAREQDGVAPKRWILPAPTSTPRF